MCIPSNNIRRVDETKTNLLLHLNRYHRRKIGRFVKLENLPMSFDSSFLIYKEPMKHLLKSVYTRYVIGSES